RFSPGSTTLCPVPPRPRSASKPSTPGRSTSQRPAEQEKGCQRPTSWWHQESTRVIAMAVAYSLVPGDRRPFAILQFDVAGHSEWSNLAPEEPIRAVTELIRAHAGAITAAYGGFELHFSGDGGAYLFLLGRENPRHPHECDLAGIAGMQLQA